VTFVDRPATHLVDDRVINHIFGCGLTIAAILGRPEIGDEVTRRLLGVIDELDMAVTAIRHAAFAALVVDRPSTLPEAPESDVPLFYDADGTAASTTLRSSELMSVASPPPILQD